MSTEVLHLLLAQRNLSLSGSRDVLLRRLADHDRTANSPALTPALPPRDPTPSTPQFSAESLRSLAVNLAPLLRDVLARDTPPSPQPPLPQPSPAASLIAQSAPTPSFDLGNPSSVATLISSSPVYSSSTSLPSETPSLPKKVEEQIVNDGPLQTISAAGLSSALRHPSIHDSNLKNRVYELIQHSWAPSTKQTYAAGIKQFISFCLAKGIVTPCSPLLPATELTLLYFVGHLSKSVSYSTVKTYLASVSYLHVNFQIPFDMGSMQLLEKSLKGLKRLKGEKLRDRRPITVTELESLHSALRPQFTDCLDNVMLWAAFTLAFFGFLRCSEFTCNSPFDPECHLSRNDIIFHPNILHAEYYDVLIKRSKTDPFRRGCRLTIGSSRNKLCPVRAMKTYLLQSSSGQTPRPLFQFTSGVPLTRVTLTSHLRHLLQGQGLAENLYASHSFRIGAATAAGSAGLPSWLIKTLGRWSSDCYERYIRTPKDVLASVPYKLTASTKH
ncbi:uncharacterized protein LOC114529267 [Dendronephthya gigantea]|nr:uncharacterized protein LOC114529267 [Dendronephthya gigantea]